MKFFAAFFIEGKPFDDYMAAFCAGLVLGGGAMIGFALLMGI